MTINETILAEAAAAKHGELRAIAERYGVNYNSLRSQLSAFERGLYGAEQPTQARDTLRSIRSLGPVPSAIRVVDEPKTLYLDRWLYASDFHVPLHSEAWLKRLVSVGMALDIEDLVIGGDLTDQDCLSSHPADLPQVDLNQAIEVAGQVVRYLKAAFKRLYVLPGNHDRRLAKAINKNLSFENLMRMFAGTLDGIVVTDNDYFYVGDSTPESPGWSCGHPRFFAAYPTKGLDVVATMRGRHILGAHSHTLGAAKIGKYWVVSPGMMCEPSITPYIQRSNGLSKFADQSQGFVLIENTAQDGDVATLFADGLTRWSDYQ